MTPEERKGLPVRVVAVLIPPLILIVAVLGSILFGFATPTESASVGAIGAMLLAAANRKLSFSTIRYAALNTMITTSIIFTIVLAASLFSLVFRGLGGEHMVEQALHNLPGGAFGAMLAVMAIMFVLGFFLDTFEIILIMLPICGPPLILLGLDPLWIGVMVAMNLQTSFMTPPFGFTLFYLRGVAPSKVGTSQIWAGALPFVVLQLMGLILLWTFPGTATWLPKKLFGPAAIEQSAPAGTSTGGFGEFIQDDGFQLDDEGMPVEVDDPFSKQ
jgi:tripartite ATP-independent transporter DctM subunit